MDFEQIVGLIAPVILTFLVQGLKKIMSINGYVALIVVFVIGGISAVLGIGPNPQPGFVDTTVNAGWIIGVATLLYSIFKKRG
jgi:hypothetical protein